MVLVLTQVNFVKNILEWAPLWLKMGYHLLWMSFGLVTMILKWSEYGLSWEEARTHKPEKTGTEKSKEVEISKTVDGLAIVFMALVIVIVVLKVLYIKE